MSYTASYRFTGFPAPVGPERPDLSLIDYSIGGVPMWRTCTSMLASGWLFMTAVMWPHRWEQTVVALTVGFAGMVLAPAAVLRPRLRPFLAALGLALAVSLFALPDSLTTSVDDVMVAFVLLLGGFYPVATIVRDLPVIRALPADAKAEPVAAVA
jgi:hypothetical protein